jgi:hypothetical protein
MERASLGSGPSDISLFMVEIRSMLVQLSKQLGGVEKSLGIVCDAVPGLVAPHGATGVAVVVNNHENCELSVSLDSVMDVYTTLEHVRTAPSNVIREDLHSNSVLMVDHTSEVKRIVVESSLSNISHSIPMVVKSDSMFSECICVEATSIEDAAISMTADCDVYITNMLAHHELCECTLDSAFDTVTVCEANVIVVKINSIYFLELVDTLKTLFNVYNKLLNYQKILWEENVFNYSNMYEIAYKRNTNALLRPPPEPPPA